MHEGEASLDGMCNSSGKQLNTISYHQDLHRSHRSHTTLHILRTQIALIAFITSRSH